MKDNGLPGSAIFIDICTEIVLNNLDNPDFDVVFLARETGLSRATLYRKSKEYSGLSPSALIRKIKLGKAMSILLNTNANISEIALESGFQNIAYFDKCFKEHYNKPPGQIRKENRSDIGSTYAEEVTENTLTADFEKNHPSGNLLHNFPLPHTSFIGRHHELSEIDTFLEKHRLLSIIGPGGIGKTRLACEWAAQTRQSFSDGIWFVNLAPLESGDYLVKRVMEVFNIPESPGRELSDTLLSALQKKELLIVLDNCEHMTSACGKICSKLVAETRGIKILSTSRVALNVSMEHRWPIQPLGMPKPGKSLEVQKAKTSDAVCLFEDRAQASDHRFIMNEENIEDVIRICGKLDAIPLALELVAGHIRYLDPKSILERLFEKPALLSSTYKDGSDRHKTLWSTFDWSYNLLKENERYLFRGLSLFPGGCTLDAAEKVYPDEFIRKEDIQDLVTALLDHSLVSTIRNSGQDIRYSMLVPLRQYAALKIDSDEKKILMGRMMDYYSVLSDRAYNERISSQVFWMKKLQAEQDNVDEVLSWSEINDPEGFYQLAASMAWFWARSNNYTYALPLLKRIVEQKQKYSEYRARALAAYARMMVYSGHGSLDQAIGCLIEASDLWTALNRFNEVAVALAEVALIYCNIDDNIALEYAMKGYEQAMINGVPAILLQSMTSLSQAQVDLGNTNEARILARKILLTAGELENPFGLYQGHHNLADCDLIEGKYVESEREYAKGLKVTHKAGDFILTNTELFGIAMSLGGQGRSTKSLRLYGAVLENAKRNAIAPPENLQMSFWQDAFTRHIIGTRKKLGEELSEKLILEGRSMDLDEVVAYALDFEKD